MNFIPPEDEGRLRAAASGVLPNGRPIVVNADGTVSVVSGTDAGFGSKTNISGTDSNANIYKIAFDSGSNKIVFGYRDGNSYTAAVVGTVSGRSISFGTPAVMESVSSSLINAIYDSNANKTVFFYRGSGGAGTAIVGTVSGTNISFGSKVTVASNVTWATGAFDSNSNKVVLSYRDAGNSSYGTSRVGTISGTGISFGTAKVFLSSNTQNLDSTFDSNSNKIVVAYRNQSSSSVGTAIVGTVSGTNINFGSSAVFNNANSVYMRCAFDSNSNKVVIIYKDGGNSSNGTAVVATVSGTNISFGSEVVYEDGTNTGSFQWTSITFDSSSNKMIVSYGDNTDSNYGKIRIGTVSGTSISFSASTTYNAAESRNNANVYDSNANKTVIAFTDFGNSQNITGIVYGDASTNLTAENYVGMSGGPVIDNSVTQVVGTPAVFESATTDLISATFDSNSNKVVIAYQDEGNSNYGTSVVGTVSASSISFGTPVVFKSGNSDFISSTFDSNSNKVVIAFRDVASSARGKAIVGTVSGTGISFGSAEDFNGSEINSTATIFDSNSNKVVISWNDKGNSERGVSIVGTVSGTSISFGSAVVFAGAITRDLVSTFDSNSNKVVVSFRDVGNSSAGTVIIGTVSGTSISFGTEVVFQVGADDLKEQAITFDTSSNKVVIAYANGANSAYGTAIVGTVSGTSISFGTPVVFEAASVAVARMGASYDSSANRVVISYRDNGNSNYGTLIAGAVSGTSISFESPVVYEAATTDDISSTFDSNSNKVVIAYQDGGNSNYGTAVVTTTGYTDINRGQVASGSSASVDIIGTVSTNQGSLTPGQSYFVQTDGTLALTAGTPSVFAGTAISATKLLVKT